MTKKQKAATLATVDFTKIKFTSRDSKRISEAAKAALDAKKNQGKEYKELVQEIVKAAVKETIQVMVEAAAKELVRVSMSGLSTSGQLTLAAGGIKRIK